MQHIQFNKVTWYSKLASIIILLLALPVLTFYIGNVYSRTYNVVAAPAEELGLKPSAWSNINLDQRELANIFDVAQTSIQSESDSHMLYNIVLLRKLGSWVHLRLDPIASDSEVHTSQMYLQKINGIWSVQASDVSLNEFCASHKGFCL